MSFCVSFHSLYVHKIRLYCCMYHYFILLSCCVIFYCMDIHSVLSIVLLMDLGFLAIMEKVRMNILLWDVCIHFSLS